jgi:hypothetical protein
MKTIEYYIKDVYGTPREYIKDEVLARQVFQLTGSKTLNQNIRGLLQVISDGQIQFKQTLRDNN